MQEEKSQKHKLKEIQISKNQMIKINKNLNRLTFKKVNIFKEIQYFIIKQI